MALTSGIGGSPSRHPPGPLRASIAGTIRNEAVEPIAHARVCVRPAGEGIPRDVERELHCTDTDANGRYELVDVYPTDSVVCALAEHRRPGQHEPLALTAGAHHTGVDLVLLSGGVEVSGTVSDLGGGAVVHSHVTTYSMVTYEPSAIVDTDDAGGFRIWVAPGPIAVNAEADGYTGERTYGIAPGAFDLVLTPESTLAGAVIGGATRLPIPGARVALYDSLDTDYGNRELSVATTDEQGRFYFDRLRPSRYFVEATTPRGFGRSDGSIQVALGQHADGMIIETQPAARVEGTVIIEGPPETPCPKPVLWLSGAPTTRTEYGASDGVVHADGLRPGTYRTDVICSGYTSTTEPREVVVSDRDVTGLIWRVVPAPARATVRGHVLTRAGVAVVAASVSVDGRHTTSKADGSFTLGNLEPGHETLMVNSEQGLGPARGLGLDLVAGETSLQEIVLDPGGSIAGSVADSDGRPASRVPLTITYPEDYKATSDSEGRFHIDNVRPGTYSIDAEQADRVSIKQHVTVRAGETSNLHFVVATASRTITGTVVDADGKPIGDAFVIAGHEIDGYADVRPWLSSSESQVATGNDGAFTIAHLVAGSYTLRAYRTGGGEAIVEHVPLGTHPRLQIKSAGSIAGTVRTPSGPPVDLMVRVVDVHTGLARREQFYRTEGRYHVEDLPAGEYRITASTGDAQGQATATLAAGTHMTSIDVDIASPVTVIGRVVDFETRQPIAAVDVSAEFDDSRSGRHAVTDAEGRFSIEGVRRGFAQLRLAAQGNAGYGRAFFERDVSVGTSIDLGDLVLVKRPNQPKDPRGMLGFHLASGSLRIERIVAASPASRSELVVGDVITAINGVDVTGVEGDGAVMLLSAPPGTTFRLGLARSVTVTLVSVPDSR